jgi:hypothetical protein
MQISSSNVLASSQQGARSQRPAAQPAEFQPLELKKVAGTKSEAGTEPSAPASHVRPGTYIDIKI